MRSRQFLQLSLLYLIAQDFVFTQSPDETSIPEPTELGAIASSEKSSITKVGNHTLVAGGDTVAEISTVRIEVSGKDGATGVQLLITEGDGIDRVLLDFIQATKLMKELYSFQNVYRSGNLRTGAMCISGVARCRPSQTEAQAICPDVEPAVYAEAIVNGIGWHHSIQHNRERIERSLSVKADAYSTFGLTDLESGT